MAQLANTHDTYDANGIREDLHGVVSMISPDERPLQKLISERDVKDTHHRWTQDALATPDLTNAETQGFQYGYADATATTEVSNYTQIISKLRLVSETADKVRTADGKKESARIKANMGKEILIDAEAIALSNQASVAGSSSVAPKMGGLRAWLSSNDNMGATGASGGYSGGLVTAATDGTQRAFTKTLLKDVISSTYVAGGNPNTMMCSPYVKEVFSGLMSDTDIASPTSEFGNKAGTIVAAADFYRSDFGVINVIPNRQMARAGASVARNAFLIEPDKLHMGWLRRIEQDKDAAKQGDATPIVMKGECTLVVDNEASCGVIADLFGIDATS